MLGLMRSAAVELARNGITVNAVMPGNVRTPGLADTSVEHQRRMLSFDPDGGGSPSPRRSARPFASSPRPRRGYITGQTLIVDGGQVLPEAPARLTPFGRGGKLDPGTPDRQRRRLMARKHVLAVLGVAVVVTAAVFTTGAASTTSRTTADDPNNANLTYWYWAESDAPGANKW